MTEKVIEDIKVKMVVRGDTKVFFVGRRTQVIWRNGRWADDNRGKAYLHYAFREKIVREFGLK